MVKNPRRPSNSDRLIECLIDSPTVDEAGYMHQLQQTSDSHCIAGHSMQDCGHTLGAIPGQAKSDHIVLLIFP